MSQKVGSLGGTKDGWKHVGGGVGRSVDDWRAV